jgi:hypothetical protein
MPQSSMTFPLPVPAPLLPGVDADHHTLMPPPLPPSPALPLVGAGPTRIDSFPVGLGVGAPAAALALVPASGDTMRALSFDAPASLLSAPPDHDHPQHDDHSTSLTLYRPLPPPGAGASAPPGSLPRYGFHSAGGGPFRLVPEAAAAMGAAGFHSAAFAPSGGSGGRGAAAGGGGGGTGPSAGGHSLAWWTPHAGHGLSATSSSDTPSNANTAFGAAGGFVMPVTEISHVADADAGVLSSLPAHRRGDPAGFVDAFDLHSTSGVGGGGAGGGGSHGGGGGGGGFSDAIHAAPAGLPTRGSLGFNVPGLPRISTSLAGNF